MRSRKIKVGGHTWTVKWVEGKAMNGLIGLTVQEELLIFINAEYPETVQRETLLHELHHVAYFTSLPGEMHDADETEKYICSSTGGLFDALTRNPWLGEYILGD